MVSESGAAELTTGRYFINVNVLIARLIATRFDRALVSAHTKQIEQKSLVYG